MTNKSSGVSRRTVLGTAGAAATTMAMASSSSAHAQESADTKPVPKLKRIRIATIGAPDLKAVETLYGDWLGYAVVERGNVAENLAASWGAPKSAGRPFIVMQPESGADVFIRAVEIDPVPGYKAMTTWGWNAIEIICDDPDALYEKLLDSPFTLLGKPKGLNNYPSIRATQFKGPAEDVLYFTTETGDRSNSLLPRPGAFIGRIFIMVVAGPDINDLQDWYADTFNMARGTINNSPVDLINEAQGLPLGSERPLTILRMAEHGNILELDGYGDNTGPRPHHDGQLPPGVAITSVMVESIDDLNVKTITPPISFGSGRIATVIGPAGELLELIEEPA
ncbi:MAG: VOC family protein [Rhodospirillaceae bacterium]